MYLGDKTQLFATVTPTNATNKGLIWASSNSKVASVDGNGNVEAKGIGTATITVYSRENGHIKATTTVTVSEMKQDEILVNSINTKLDKLILKVDEEINLNATVTPTNATNKGLIYSTSDKEVVTVDENGTVIAKGVGTATVTIKSVGNANVQKFVKVTVIEEEAEILETATVTIKSVGNANVQKFVKVTVIEEEAEILETATVTIKHISGDQELEVQSLEFELGEIEIFAKNIEGYELISDSKVTINLVENEEEQVITFEYKKIEEEPVVEVTPDESDKVEEEIEEESSNFGIYVALGGVIALATVGGVYYYVILPDQKKKNK